MRAQSIPLLVLSVMLVCHHLAGAQDVGCGRKVAVKRAGKLSAGVYRPDMTLVRTLKYLKDVQPGEFELRWDGLDDYGQPVEPGEYRIKSVVSNASAEFVMTVGNGLNPSQPDDLGKVKAGRSLAVDPRGRLILVDQIGGEAAQNLQIFSSDGRLIRQFEPPYFIRPMNGAASDGRYAYILTNAEIEGRRVAGVARIDLEVDVASAAFKPYDRFPGGIAPIPDGTADAPQWQYATPSYGELWGYQGSAANWWIAHSAAVHEGRLYIAVPSVDEIVVMDASNGKIVDRIEVDGVQAVAVGPGGMLFACAGRKILSMTLAGKKRAVFADGFEAPYCLAVDSQGNVVVADHKPAPVVVKLSPEGKPLWTFGVPGAREGQVLPQKLFFPSSIAADKDGSIYVSEADLPRVQKLAPDGQPVYSLHTIYAEEMCVDPEQPEEFYATYGGGRLVRYILDYEKRTWRLDACWWRTMWPGKFMTVDMRVARSGGRRFLAVWDGGIFRIDGYVLTMLKHWASPMILEDGTAYPIGYDGKTGVITVSEIPCGGFDLGGCPIYRDADRKQICATDPAFNLKHELSPMQCYHVYPGAIDPERNLYIMGAKQGRGEGILYWARMYEKACLEKYDRTGRLRWAVGRKTRSYVQPGEFYGPNKVRYHDGLVYHSDVSGVVSVFDPDGLMVGFLMKDAARGFGFDDDPLGSGGEAWCHHIFTHPKSKKLYYIHQDHGAGQYRVIEFKGLKDLDYSEGNVVLKQAAPAAPPDAESQKPEYVLDIPKAGRVRIDGDLSDWQDSGTVTLWTETNSKELPYATLRFRYDVRNLYVAVHVLNEDTPAVNRNASTPDLMWRGDCLELYVGTDFNSWRKRTYAETDLQFMVAPGPDSNGKAYCYTRHAWVDGSTVAWKIDADKKGYTLEAEVPWQYMKNAVPKPGARLPFDMRVMVGTAKGDNYSHNLIWSARNMAFNDTSEWGQAVLGQFAVTGEIEVSK